MLWSAGAVTVVLMVYCKIALALCGAGIASIGGTTTLMPFPTDFQLQLRGSQLYPGKLCWLLLDYDIPVLWLYDFRTMGLTPRVQALSLHVSGFYCNLYNTRAVSGEKFGHNRWRS